jgi:hypothetical protein
VVTVTSIAVTPLTDIRVAPLLLFVNPNFTLAFWTGLPVVSVTLAVRIELCPAATEVGDPLNDAKCVPLAAFPSAVVSALLPQAGTMQISAREISSPKSRVNFVVADFIISFSSLIRKLMIHD